MKGRENRQEMKDIDIAIMNIDNGECCYNYPDNNDGILKPTATQNTEIYVDKQNEVEHSYKGNLEFIISDKNDVKHDNNTDGVIENDIQDSLDHIEDDEGEYFFDDTNIMLEVERLLALDADATKNCDYEGIHDYDKHLKNQTKDAWRDTDNDLDLATQALSELSYSWNTKECSCISSVSTGKKQFQNKHLRNKSSMLKQGRIDSSRTGSSKQEKGVRWKTNNCNVSTEEKKLFSDNVQLTETDFSDRATVSSR